MNEKIDIAFDRIGRLVALMGHFLTLFLSLILWWGIYSGIDITVSAQKQNSRNLVVASDLTDTDVPVAHVNRSVLFEKPDELVENSWVTVSGF